MLAHETWMENAACKGFIEDENGNDPFFPPKGKSSPTGMIVCLGCPVRRQCREYRDRTGSIEGLWGGEVKKVTRKEKP